MEKTSREYAEKLAKLHKVNISDIWSEASFKEGYMKAVEETNVNSSDKELLKECLYFLNFLRQYYNQSFLTDTDFKLNELLTKLNKHLNK